MIGHHYHLWKGFSTYIWPTHQKGIVLTSIQVGKHPAHNNGRFLYFHLGRNHIWLTMMEELCSSTHAGTTSCSQWWNISALSSKPEPHPTHNDGRSLFFHPGHNHILLTMMKYFCTYIHPGMNTSCSQWWKGSALTSIQAGTHPPHNDGRDLHLHLTW